MREYMLVLLVAVSVTYVVASIARRFAYRYNAVALVRDRDVHTKHVPYFGGIALLAGTAAAFLVGGSLPWLGSFPIVGHDTRVVFAACALISAVGLMDDLIELNALAKISGQVVAAGLSAAARPLLQCQLNATLAALSGSSSPKQR